MGLPKKRLPPPFCCCVTPTGANLSFNDLRTTKDLRFGSGTSGFVFENQYEKPRFEVKVVGVMMSYDQNIEKTLTNGSSKKHAPPPFVCCNAINNAINHAINNAMNNAINNSINNAMNNAINN